MQRAMVYLALLTAVWSVDAALGTGVFWNHDLRTHHMPWRAWAAGEWLSGRIPMWAPGVGNGFPLMADGQTGVFYAPTMLLFMVFPPAIALNYAVLVHIWFAGLGTFLFVRSLGHREVVSFFAAIAFAFGGFMATHGVYLGMQNAVAWLPWLMLALHTGRTRWAAVCIAMMLVAGHPQIAVFMLMFALPMALVWHRGKEGGIAVVLGLLLASPQLLATWELAGHSLRGGGVDSAFASIGSLPPQEILNAVLPKLFGYDRPADVAQTYFHRGPNYWGQGVNHWEMAFYLGIPVAYFAMFSRRRKAFVVAAGVALLLMLGHHTPLWPMLRALPVLDGFRFPVRFAVVLVFAVVVLAADGMERVLDARSDRQEILGWLTLGGAALATLSVIGAHEVLRLVEPTLGGWLTDLFYARQDAVPQGPLAALRHPGAEAQDIPAKVEHILASLRHSSTLSATEVMVPLGILVGIGAAIIALSRRRVATYGFAVGMSAMLFADLFWFGANYQGTVARRLVEARPIAADLIAGGGDRSRATVLDRRQPQQLDLPLMSASLGLLFGTRDVIVTSPLLMVRNEEVLALTGLDVGDTGPQKVARFLENRHLVDLMGVRWILTRHVLNARGVRLAHEGLVRLYENELAMPSAFALGCVQTTDQPLTALSDFDPRQVALVEGVTGLPECERGGGVGQVTVVAERPHKVVLEANVAEPGLVVLTDSWFPGWQATLDGKPVEILRTDYLFRGVVTPTGRHRIVFKYRPDWFWLALVLVTLGLGGLVALRRTRIP